MSYFACFLFSSVASLVLSVVLLIFAIFRSYSVVLVVVSFSVYTGIFIAHSRVLVFHLERQIQFARTVPGLQCLVPAMQQKLRLFRNCRRLVLTYCLIFPTWLLLVTALFQNDEWIGEIGVETITLLFCLFLGYLFHLRDFRPFEDQANNARKVISTIARSQVPKYVCIVLPPGGASCNDSSTSLAVATASAERPLNLSVGYVELAEDVDTSIFFHPVT